MYFNVNFNVFFKLIKVHLLVSELYMKQVNVAVSVHCVGYRVCVLELNSGM